MADDVGALLSQTRYLPFGGVRTDLGAIAETDLGYTGQRNIASLGLMDYRARFYDPSLKRFTQPDSIVPGAGNSQAWNRYSYGYNNPVKYNDPSGHLPISSDYEFCRDILCNGSLTVSLFRSVLRSYEVQLEGTWTLPNAEAAYWGVHDVGSAFANSRGDGETAAEAFQAIYDPITFTWGRNNATGQCADPIIDSGGCTSNEHQINFWGLTGGRSPEKNMHRMIKNIVHELGHAYDNLLGNAPRNDMSLRHDNFIRDRNRILRPNINGLDWQQNTLQVNYETWADMFIAWTYNAWNTDPDNADIVMTAQRWMNGWMP